MITVFIIEDHKIVSEGLSAIISSETDIRVLGNARCGADACNALETDPLPDVILLDLHLRDAMGIDLAKELLSKHPSLNIIILTMESQLSFLLHAIRAGVKGYLLKDSDNEELIYAIRQVSKGRPHIYSSFVPGLMRLLGGIEKERTYNKMDIHFSKRELEILQLIMDGYTNQEIADKLFTSKRTVEGHRQALINRTGVKNTAELVKFAMENHVLTGEID